MEANNPAHWWPSQLMPVYHGELVGTIANCGLKLRQMSFNSAKC
jgi:hypothetical protein